MRLHGVDPGDSPSGCSTKVKGFSGFGFPKSHAAAFGLLAYQSTWLRVHYGPEFLCALLNEQPMGFYPPDALVHEATATGDGGGRARRQQLRRRSARWTLRGGCVIGLGYIRGVRRMEIEALVAERERSGPFTSLSELASRAGTGAPALDLLAWSGACDSLVLAAACRGASPPRSRPAGSCCGSWVLPWPLAA